MNALIQYTVGDIKEMASSMAASNFFGVKSGAEALSLMLIAQAEGMHPAAAMRDYHVIQGKPALKADAMLARFQQAGGKVVWNEYSDSRVEGVFTHPQGGTITVDWDMDRAKTAGLGAKGMWKTYPRQMLRSRVISEAIRAIFPGVLGGFYSSEEVADFDEPKMKDITPKDNLEGMRQVNRDFGLPENGIIPPAKIAKAAKPKINHSDVPFPDLTTKAENVQELDDLVTVEAYHIPLITHKGDPEKVDWQAWAKELAEKIKQAQSIDDLNNWTSANFREMNSLQHADVKLHNLLLQRVAEASNRITENTNEN